MVNIKPGTGDLYTTSILSPPSQVILNIYTPTLDASLYNRFMVETTGSDITSMTITNPLNDQEIEIMFYRSAAQTIAFPSNVRWAANVAPTFTANTRNYVRFKYLSATSLWYETSRSLAVPNT